MSVYLLFIYLVIQTILKTIVMFIICFHCYCVVNHYLYHIILLYRDRFVHSDSYAQSLPIQYRRIEQFGVLSVSGTDRLGRPVIVFSSCRLPPVYQISHEILFELVIIYM